MNKNVMSLLLLLSTLVFVSCERKPFVEHKLKFEKVADDCSQQQGYFRMVSNVGGERYEFEKCLAADFNSDQLITERKGDTVLVTFTKGPGEQPGKVYHLTLDIDSYPRYRFLTIDKDTYSISSKEK